ncbi:carbohydrate-binding module family 1 protein [Pleomassaria siparia CBS 279.74]|uniref:Carbohydrate-binding module family 1 protein n=1 Tax=Pleomassaria siparia CBS 279.74 TaxID=1314801 RepID=A0A6G1KDT7_9PLEO|nr:carbohydrate-binding module family 1 protein [Pleomassaria siparia CBS 279.74]
MAARSLLSSLFVVAASLAGTRAQETVTDAATGITFLQSTTDVDGYTFGFALPEEGTGSDFIGQINAPITTGWAGFSLTSSMTAGLLVVAWPNGDEVVSSLRKATGYANPPLYTGDAVLKPISNGISVTSTSFTYTFLCQNCTDIGGLSFTSTTDTSPFGWAISKLALADASSASGALTSHVGTGQGINVLTLSTARSASYSTWAALASDAVPAPSTGNSTTPTNGTAPAYNGTVSISNATYDYIVVGGGGSGIISAQRLVETGKSVLLIERGKASFYSSGGDLTVPWNDTVSVYEVPAMYNWLASYPGNDALCSDTPAMAGCILGGGTAVNGLAFIRPPAHDFDDKWPAGWQWSDVSASADRFYARNPGSTRPSADGKFYDWAVYDVLSKNLAGAGWQQVDSNDDPDAKSKAFSLPSINVLGGRRAGPVATYLPLAVGKDNFKLILNTMVLRAVRTNSTITGVETQAEDGSRMIINVNAGGKVILAAGAMSSPRILFRSGIGPTDQINTVKSGSTAITLPDESEWINSPVGFVRDHTNLGVTFTVKNGMQIMSGNDYKSPTEANIELWNKASGPLVESSVMRLNSWRTVTTSDNTSLIVQTHNYATNNDTINTLFVLTHGTTSVGQLAIEASGNTIWSKSPYLQTDTDKEAMAMAIDEWLAMSRLPNSTITYAGPANATGADIVRDVESSAGTHMTGTTIMGLDDGSKGGNSVVDIDCKVYGTDNLFVVDAGMHADVPTGNTQAIVGVAAEHAIQRIIALGTGASGGGNSTAPVPSTPSSVSAVPVPTVVIPAAGNATLSTPPIGSTSAVVVPSSSSTIIDIVPITTAAPTNAAPAPTAVVTVGPYGTCGGKNYAGSVVCADGWTCRYQNDWYSQCVSV